MARKRSSVSKQTNAVTIDVDRQKYGRWAAILLFGLIAGIFFCLICGWISGDTSYNEISDNIVTALLQNYNYILASLVLVPVIAYIYSKIKDELKAKFISDDQMMLWGFLIGVFIFLMILAVCSTVYKINSSTYYGLNSATTSCCFLAVVVVLATLALVCLMLKCSVLGRLLISMLKRLKIKNENGKELKKIFVIASEQLPINDTDKSTEDKELKNLTIAIKKYLPIILMIMFLIWTFVSCMLAPGAADDIIGAKAAEKTGASPNEVLSKTLNGCYNLKDGFWAFLMYGSFMLGAMLIGKENEKLKKYLIIAFTVMITVLSAMTLGMSVYYNRQYALYREKYDEFMKTSGELELSDSGIQWSDFERKLKSDVYEVNSKWYIFAQRGVFRNSNHFAYVLCMGVIAAMWLAITEKNWTFKLLYLISFVIQLSMLIINDTFGGYLGVFVAIVASIIYGIVKFCSCFVNENDLAEESKANSEKDLINSAIALFLVVVLFVSCSRDIKNQDEESYVVNNVKGFIEDIGVFVGYMTTTENATQVDVSKLDKSITKAGSGRGETWLKVWELIKQRPLFGYGLECLLFQFSGQFNVGEGRTHNLLLQLLATVGIPGTIMYFAALAIIFFRLLSNWESWSDVEKITTFVGISYIVTALTGNSTYYTSPFFMMFLGFVALTQWKKKKEE